MGCERNDYKELIGHKYGCEYKIKLQKVTDKDDDKLTYFWCENDYLMTYIEKLRKNDKDNVPYMFLDVENNRAIAFFTIKANGIMARMYDEIDKKKYTTVLPAIIFDNFVVRFEYWHKQYKPYKTEYRSEKYKKNSLSAVLCKKIIQYIKKHINKDIGARYICIYAVPDFKDFYYRLGFKNFEPYMVRDKDPHLNRCIPMYMEIN